eukprot:Nk52_evm31s262 gene=Nk52_evmTU31s262
MVRIVNGEVVSEEDYNRAPARNAGGSGGGVRRQGGGQSNTNGAFPIEGLDQANQQLRQFIAPVRVGEYTLEPVVVAGLIGLFLLLVLGIKGLLFAAIIGYVVYSQRNNQ